MDKIFYFAIAVVIAIIVGMYFVVSTAKEQCAAKGGTLVYGTCIKADKIDY